MRLGSVLQNKGGVVGSGVREGELFAACTVEYCRAHG